MKKFKHLAILLALLSGLLLPGIRGYGEVIGGVPLSALLGRDVSFEEIQILEKNIYRIGNQVLFGKLLLGEAVPQIVTETEGTAFRILTMDPVRTKVEGYRVYPDGKVEAIKELGETKTDKTMLFINQENPVPKKFSMVKVRLEKLGYNVSFSSLSISKEIEPYFREMLKDLTGNRITQLRVVSGYRTSAQQAGILSRTVAQFRTNGAKDPMSSALFRVMKPGYSEHHTGLAVDVSRAKLGTFAGTKEAKWLEENGHEYGFVIRYPENATKITKIRYEPWHLRYVGVWAASYMKEEKIVYEQFAERAKKGIAFKGAFGIRVPAGSEIQNYSGAQVTRHEFTVEDAFLEISVEN